MGQMAARTAPRAQSLTKDAASFYDAVQSLARRFAGRDLDAVCSIGISIRECQALELLTREPLSVNGLAGILGLDKSTVSRLVQRLVSQKLVTRKADQRDGRAIVLTPTAKGRGLYESAYRDSLDCYVEMLAGIPARDREALIESLRTAAELLDQKRASTCR